MGPEVKNVSEPLDRVAECQTTPSITRSGWTGQLGHSGLSRDQMDVGTRRQVDQCHVSRLRGDREEAVHT